MSQPKRFRCLTTDEQREFHNKVIMPGLVMCEDGNLVAYSEYAALSADKDIEIKVLQDEVDCVREENAALAAEKEALVQQGIRDHGDWRSKLNFLEADYKAEVARLTAENERLREAGDAMADDLRSCQMDDGNKLLVDWEAAKERRDTK